MQGGGDRGAIAPQLFVKIEGTASGATPHYLFYYYLPLTFRKPLTFLKSK